MVSFTSNYQQQYSSLFLFFSLLHLSLLICFSSPALICHKEERIALLQFKQLFSINGSAATPQFCSTDCDQTISSWKEGTNCCAWNGVTCDYETGHVIGLHLTTSCLYGTIPSNSTLFSLLHLKQLYLGCNNFNNYQISPSFGRLTNLTDLDLAYTHLSGQIPSDILMFHLPNLGFLNLSGNKITGTIPPSLFNLVHLHLLDLSSNQMQGTIELDMFAKLEKISYLDLSNSGLSLTITNLLRSAIFPSISTLLLSACNISKVPAAFLKTHKELRTLDLSNNKIHQELDPAICNLRSIQYVDLSNNQLYGLIPTCLANFSQDMLVLNLQRNNFRGTIPQSFGQASMLEALDLSHNELQGVIPRSLANCTHLKILDLGHNLITDVFPFWLENLPVLQVLVLRNNRFYGPIGHPTNASSFPYLGIICLAHNDFTGTLPKKYFESWDSMMVANEDASHLDYIRNGAFGYYSITIINKGLEMEYVRILTIFKAIDFSYNKLSGEIPASIGRLKALHVLNLSGNGLTGPIPMSLENLTELESLDLSKNKLTGEIPWQLTSLTFLEVLDVSENNLTGLIPRGKQFETFSNASYEGNLGLCGIPLSKICGNVKVADSPTLPSSTSHGSKFIDDCFGWEEMLIGYGCGLVISLVIGSWILRRREEWLVRILG